MFHGTSRILSLVGPEKLSSLLHRELFDAFRVLEANRAILFGDDTLLSQPAWILQHYNRPISLTQQRRHWNPVDTIFVLKLRIATFSRR